MTEHEIALRLNDHDHEIGSLKHRVEDCEKQQTTLQKLAESVNKLAINMDIMLKNQEKQDVRIHEIEQAPADDYKHYKRQIVGYILVGIIGAILGAVFSNILK